MNNERIGHTADYDGFGTDDNGNDLGKNDILDSDDSFHMNNKPYDENKTDWDAPLSKDLPYEEDKANAKKYDEMLAKQKARYQRFGIKTNATTETGSVQSIDSTNLNDINTASGNIPSGDMSTNTPEGDVANTDNNNEKTENDGE